MESLWAGIDVGGRRKGFHLALVDEARVVALEQFASPDAVAAFAAGHRVQLVGVDSPYSPAPDGDTSRTGERDLVRAKVCNIRWTPDRQRLSANPAYYEWIEHGFELYAALAAAAVPAIECFPTASWTRWLGPRGTEPRSVWSTRGLAATGLARPARRLSQDERDAVAAALTARAHTGNQTESFGDIVVPLGRDRHDQRRRRKLAEIAAEVAEEMGAAGRPLSVPPDPLTDGDDDSFWDEVERRFESERS